MVKTLKKSPPGAKANSLLPINVPNMAKLLRYYETDDDVQLSTTGGDVLIGKLSTDGEEVTVDRTGAVVSLADLITVAKSSRRCFPQLARPPINSPFLCLKTRNFASNRRRRACSIN